jgi:molybdopterin-guanine dinucleotide biosynthesis protein A
MGRRTGLRAVADAVTDAGPIAGVIAGLNALASADVVLVAACDLPGVTSSFFAELARSLAASPQADAVIPETEGGVEPCLAAYRPRAARLLEREAAAGRLGLAEASGALCVVPLRIPSGDPRRTCFRNVNTPADLAAAQAP